METLMTSGENQQLSPSPPSNGLEINKPPGGLIEDLRYHFLKISANSVDSMLFHCFYDS